MSTDSSDDPGPSGPFTTLERLMGDENAKRATFLLTMPEYNQNIRTSGIVISQLTSALRKAQQFQARQARARNALLPIHTLPRELLSQIWTDITYSSAINGQDGVWALAQVSTLWADLLFVSSETWCAISSAFPLKRTRLALKKSANRPLHVFLGMEPDVVETFDTVLPQCHRWRELRIVAGLPEITLTLQVTSLPMLDSLHVLPHYDIDNIAQAPNLLDSPGLRSLFLESVPLDWPSPSAAPAGLRSLSLYHIRNGPTFSQLFAILSTMHLLEQLQLVAIGPPAGDEPLSSSEERKSLVMPHLRKLWVWYIEQTLIPLLLSCIRADSCRSVIAAPFDLDLTSSQNLAGLRSLLSPIASSAEKLFLTTGDSGGHGYATLSTFDEPNMFEHRQEAGRDTSGFTIGFLVGRNSEHLQIVVSFLAYTAIPISLSVRCSELQTQSAIAQLDWDQLPSIREPIIHGPLEPSPILLSLCKARGPRHSPRWPCPQLTVLRIPGLDWVPFGFEFILKQRWGAPEADGLKRDTSRPARLSLCQVPRERLSKLLSPEDMAHFADVWEESAPVPQIRGARGQVIRKTVKRQRKQSSIIKWSLKV